MHKAALNGYDDMAVLLLANKANVNAKDEAGGTPLHWAKNTNVAAVLLQNHADVNARDNTGQTPLHGSMAGKTW